MVKKTILVPTIVTKIAPFARPSVRPEPVRGNYWFARLPVTKVVQRCYTTMVPEQRTRTETYCV